MQNIGQSNADDAFYRYKMPKLVTKVGASVLSFIILDGDGWHPLSGQDMMPRAAFRGLPAGRGPWKRHQN